MINLNLSANYIIIIISFIIINEVIFNDKKWFAKMDTVK